MARGEVQLMILTTGLLIVVENGKYTCANTKSIKSSRKIVLGKLISKQLVKFNLLGCNEGLLEKADTFVVIFYKL